MNGTIERRDKEKSACRKTLTHTAEINPFFTGVLRRYQSRMTRKVFLETVYLLLLLFMATSFIFSDFTQQNSTIFEGAGPAAMGNAAITFILVADGTKPGFTMASLGFGYDFEHYTMDAFASYDLNSGDPFPDRLGMCIKYFY